MSKRFASIYDKIMNPFEKAGIGKLRNRLVSQAKGDVLEIGSGTGINFPLYRQASSLTAIEPNPFMIEQSKLRAEGIKMPIKILESKGEKLPFKDNSFDSIVITLVLCSVMHPKQVLLELQRVCKADGQILILEHVKPDNRVLQFVAEIATPFWRRICDGCHLNRNTVSSILESQIEVKNYRTYALGIFAEIVGINRKL
jgi:ubiquinone/menaquinone biosynthesis C-methylase UbiE